MRKVTAILAAGTLLGLVPEAAGAMSLEEVIEKHVTARGGRESWQAVRTMKMTGSFTAFSKVAPFTLHKKRDNKYHMDHTLNERPVIIGYDGETAWWVNHWYQEGPQRVTGQDLTVLMGELDLATPLFDYKEKGYEARLLGEVEMEGLPAIGVELTRPDESVETWYLDPGTYLEIGRKAPGSDSGQPAEQITFYDDFREIEGVVIPYFNETQWYTRDRIMDIESVEINVPVDDELFEMPPPLGMGPFLPMAGDWRVTVAQRQSPQAEFSERERTSRIESLLRGALLRESYETAEGNQVIRTLSYDQYRERYRMTEIEDSRGLLDLMVGNTDDDGRLVVSNLETGSPTEMFGMTIFFRTAIYDVTDGGFKSQTEVSIDGGENWWVASKETYTRSDE
jgi:hypothetical protein